jgi:hypothetical protein
VDSSGSGKGSVVGCCEHGNEPPSSIKGGGEFVAQVRLPLTFQRRLCSMEVNNCNPVRFQVLMEAVRTSGTSVDNNFTRQYIPEDNSEQLQSLPNSKTWFFVTKSVYSLSTSCVAICDYINPLTRKREKSKWMASARHYIS